MRKALRSAPMLALLTSLLLAAGGRCHAEDAPPPGRSLYLRYCSACHGPLAHGDGVTGSLMRPTPSDLTRLAARNGGEFPMALVMRKIDGRDIPRAHGEPAMPVWGQILSEELAGQGTPPAGVERRVHERIYAIAEYLRSIQRK